MSVRWEGECEVEGDIVTKPFIINDNFKETGNTFWASHILVIQKAI
jgi:hypothetical protein